MPVARAASDERETDRLRGLLRQNFDAFEAIVRRGRPRRWGDRRPLRVHQTRLEPLLLLSADARRKARPARPRPLSELSRGALDRGLEPDLPPLRARPRRARARRRCRSRGARHAASRRATWWPGGRASSTAEALGERGTCPAEPSTTASSPAHLERDHPASLAVRLAARVGDDCEGLTHGEHLGAPEPSRELEGISMCAHAKGNVFNPQGRGTIEKRGAPKVL